MFHYTPLGSSPAGLCLTSKNWQDSGITSLAFDLDVLLIKPGFDLLMQIPDFARYMGWSGKLILNARKLLSNKEGNYSLTSPFDGNKISITLAQLKALIIHIKPEAVLLPHSLMRACPEFLESWSESVFPFISVEDSLTQDLSLTYGVYFDMDYPEAKTNYMKQLKLFAHMPRYITGNLDLDLLQFLKNEGVEWIESDQPAQAGMQGKVFTSKGMIDLKEDAAAREFKAIDPECTCTVCSEQLTQAYLHHLFAHTPLLCQRFLIQHNVFFVGNES